MSRNSYQRKGRDKMKLDSVIVGHPTVDVNVLPHGIIENILGGAPTYAGFALTSLGKNAGIVSKIGKDFPEHFPPLFSKFSLNTEGILATPGKTTKFENTYSEEGEREQKCKEVADPIAPEDIPEAYMNADSFYISPVLNEVSPETLSEISKSEGIVMLDPQGIFRKVDESENITLETPSNLEEYLAEVDIVKIGKEEFQTFGHSEDELLEKLSEMGPEICILTLGEAGCKVFNGGEITKIDSIDVDAEDLTGAGDVFGAAFLAKYLDSQDSVKSARYATAAAGLKIEYKGPTGFPSSDEVEEAVKSNY